MKKILGVLILLTALLTACSSGEKKNAVEKNYDDDFVTTLADALHKRWEDPANESDNLGSSDLANLTQIEIDTLAKEDFPNKKFEDTKLKELAISYINELNSGVKTAKESSDASIIDNWNIHYSNRTKILVAINNIKKIPLSGDDEDTFQGLLNAGNEFEQQESFDNKIKSLLTTITFVEKPQEYESDYKDYEAVVQNTTGSEMTTFSANVYLLDASGTRIDTQYINANDWGIDQKITFTFSTDKEFSKIEIKKNYIELAK